MRIAQTLPQAKYKFAARSIWQWLRWILIGGLVLLMVLAGVLVLAGQQAKARLRVHYPPPGQLVDIGGYKLHLYCQGHGSPTVLLEAGLNDFSVQWARVQPEVAKFTRVCSYDRAGLGWSDPSPHPRTSGFMATELQALLSQARVSGPYLLVGHSFGGITLRQFARQSPQTVTGMVLVDSAHEAQVTRLPGMQNALDGLQQQFQTLHLLNHWGLLALSPAQIPNRGLPEDALAHYRARLAATTYFVTAFAESRAFTAGRGALPPSGALGTLPLIVISRGQPEPLPGLSASEQVQYEATWRELQAELASLSTNHQQWMAERSGHDIHLHQPELVVEAIRQLMQSQFTGEK